MSISNLHSELENFPELFDAFIVLLDFVRDLEPGHFVKSESQWTYDPNFLAFTLHYKRKHHVVVYVRGWPSEYAEMKHLPLESVRYGSYSKCYLESVSQIDALLFYIRRSHELWSKGRGRKGTRQRIVEE